MRRCKNISSFEYKAILGFASYIALLALIGFVYFHNKNIAETQIELLEKASQVDGLEIYQNAPGIIVPFLYLILFLLPLFVGLGKRFLVSMLFTVTNFVIFSMESMSFFYRRFDYERATLGSILEQTEQHFSPIGIYLYLSLGIALVWQISIYRRIRAENAIDKLTFK